MYRFLKFLHLVGFALFLGSILAHIVEVRVQPSDVAPSVLAYVYDTVSLSNLAITLPGLALAVLSGIGMTAVRRRELPSQRWFWVHAGLGVVLIATSAVIYNAGERLKAAAAVLASGQAGQAVLANAASAEQVQRYVGLLNTVIVVVSVSLAVTQSRAAGRQRLEPTKDQVS